ncbi:MAG: hypothetical protein AVDCRST_MAG20-834 [uncultured Acidimicrobiales bacterium]|uniref:Uncharacterized protein n=1 Tax=uncultured Acidimicrobiales bacterium TaxID=310071 RepID=A0A6J4HH67_9ACTN|nr:MAG: hypothetical protein AVDCRST_MAG20-834 [uncultured Acidimicrobiales bacterium]
MDLEDVTGQHAAQDHPLVGPVGVVGLDCVGARFGDSEAQVLELVVVDAVDGARHRRHHHPCDADESGQRRDLQADELRRGCGARSRAHPEPSTGRPTVVAGTAP